MLMLTLFSWWYGSGWVKLIRNCQKRIKHLAALFSVAILFRTLFSPWRRIISYPGAGLDAHLRAMVDNLVSRVVGFAVRIGVLVTAGLMLAVFSCTSVIQIIVWPLLPPAALALLVWGLL